MLAKTTALDRKTAVIEKTQKNIMGDFRGMGGSFGGGENVIFCNKSPCNNCGDFRRVAP
jgi:hypothetical protein